MEKLHHNGVLVPPLYEGKGLTIKVEDKNVKLKPEQEEMALAWAKKVGTTYVEDPVFVRNFHRDFSKKLGIDVRPGDVDFSEVLIFVEEERTWKANLSRMERKSLAAQRKTKRMENKERYGYAWVDGVKMEIANYAAEPNCIFMGRGKHPLRGRWKEGPREEDIELNLSQDASRPPGKWKDVIWRPGNMWIARWRDRLTGKIKYIWLSDSSFLKQRKDIEKFEKARELRRNLELVQEHILKNLNAEDLRRRKAATVSFLIDKLKIRIGDEKDPDEADTVGASTLRPEHLRYNGDGTVTFKFLGKDSVPHVFRIKLPEKVIKNLKEFAANSRSTLFDGIGSKQVSELLDEVMSGLSAKVFRTSYASEAVEKRLEKTPVKIEDPEYVKKYVATMANLEAAQICNHRRTVPKTWKSSLEKKKIRLKALKIRVKESQNKLKQKAEEAEANYKERLKKKREGLEVIKEKLETYERQLEAKKREGKPVRTLERRIRLKEKVYTRQRQLQKALKTKYMERISKLRERRTSRRQRDEAAIEKLKLKITTQKETRDYNLGTSLKSYIDPRIYHGWGKQVDYDWKRYYPKALQKKFSWVETHKDSKENQLNA